MRSSLRYLQLNELIVHDIPKKLSKRLLREAPDSPAESPLFSQVASPINMAVIKFFHDKISETIGSSSAIDITFDSTSKSPVGRLVNEYLSDNASQHVAITTNIARFLFDTQNAQNSSGLLLFIHCSFREIKYLAILKVEREEGVRVKQQFNNGLMTFDVEHIHDLMLTKRTKLFKIVLFYLKNQNTKGILCDQQLAYSNKDAADFFLIDFLGCRVTEEPQVQTKKFFETVQKYINEKIDSPEQKGALVTHLLSEMTSQNIIINPTEFARRVLPVNQRDEYINYIKQSNCITGSFTKDNSMIQDRLKRIQYDFDSGISVFGSQIAINSKSRLADLENGELKMEIIDRLKQVRSK